MPSILDRYHFRLSAQHETKFHKHASYEINYFYEGRCKMMLGDRCVEMSAGCLLIMDGLTPHGPIMNEPCTYSMLKFDAMRTRPLVHEDIDLLRPFQQLRNYCWQLAGEEKNEFEQLMRRLELLQGQTDPIGVYRMQTVFVDLLLFICELTRKTDIEQSDFPACKEVKVKALMAYIDDHYMQELTLDKLSREACLSKFYLTRLFKQFTGLTVFEYVNRQRITQAQLLLLAEKSTSVTDICFRVGFKELAHFSKNFKQLVGVSPEHYRKSLRVV
ncbi:MAG: AraC family transcriptional regulator [Paenibacillus sp.]|jgi:AraC-like DNA-binding protein|nr:AraC family transcriptional regulator [Paenibacillus sp.]